MKESDSPKPRATDGESGLDDIEFEPKSVMTGLVFGGLFLLVLELLWTVTTGGPAAAELPTWKYVVGVGAMTLGIWLVHAVPFWGLYELGRRFVARTVVLLPGFAAIFGVSWQQTVVQGDGIGAHPYFPVIRNAFLIGVPLVCAVVVWSFLTPKIPALYRKLMAGVFVVVATVFNLTVLLDYQAFHGHLAVFNTAIFVGLLLPVVDDRRLQRTAVAVATGLVVALGISVTDHEDVRTNVQRFAHLPASISAGMPAGDLVRVEPDKIFTVEKASSEDLAEYYEVFFEDTAKFESSPPRGDNVLFVVLESVRADYWAEPELTPKFHDWKEHGVYIPDAIANYPATPLAYGAMFAAQPPSVLAQTPYWGDNRLFDGIEAEFDELFFTQPDISWFEHTAITDFFLPDDATVNAHPEGPDGLAYLRDELSELDGDDSFFSWVHLYEPHDPYEAREPWVDGATDDRSAYRSEIAYTDHHLGEFMNWFFDQDFADDTLVILIADHGQGMGEEVLGEPFWGHHVHVHNVVSRVPMFVAGPGFPEATRDDELHTMQLDVMPTIYDFTGQAMPGELMPQGNSVYRLLEDRPVRPLVTEAFSIRGHQFFEFVAGTQQGQDLDELRREFHEISTDGHGYSPKIGLQHGDYKLVHDRLLDSNYLYNVADDPDESYDLYREVPDEAEVMVDRLEQWNILQGEIVRRLDAVMKQ